MRFSQRSATDRCRWLIPLLIAALLILGAFPPPPATADPPDRGIASVADGSAEDVLGQADFTSRSANRGGSVAANTLSVPYAVAYDPTGNRLFVADSSNHRVLVYATATITNGQSAVAVLGQADFTSSSIAITQSGLSFPSGLAYDAAGSRLFVADVGNSRVLVYDTAAITNGEDAIGVLGQANFTSGNSNRGGSVAANTLSRPIGVAYDTASNILYVADNNNHRALLFNAVPTGTAVSINGGAAATNSVTATLTLTATGAADMQVSESASFTGASYQTYATTLPFTLTARDGARAVYARFRDSALGVSTAVSDTILLDTTPPLTFTLASPATGAYTNTASPTFTWAASSDATSGLAKYQLYIDGALNRDNILTGTLSITPTGTLTDGLHTWSVAAVDAAGNSRASTSTYTVTVDTVAPSLSGVGATEVTTRTATITWTSSEAASSQVEYGPTAAYGSSTTEADVTTRVVSHTVPLSGLAPGTTYHYRAKGRDEAGNSGVSSDGTFTTTTTAVLLYLPMLARASSGGW